MNNIDIKVSNYFPFQLQVVGYGALFAFVYLIFSNILLSPVFLVIGLFITTTHYRLEINGRERYFKEYLWICGFKSGEKFKFQEYECVVINSTKANFEYGNIAVRRYGVEQLYKGFIKFTGQEESAFIGESKSLESIENKANQI